MDLDSVDHDITMASPMYVFVPSCYRYNSDALITVGDLPRRGLA